MSRNVSVDAVLKKFVEIMDDDEMSVYCPQGNSKAGWVDDSEAGVLRRVGWLEEIKLKVKENENGTMGSTGNYRLTKAGLCEAKKLKLLSDEEYGEYEQKLEKFAGKD